MSGTYPGYHRLLQKPMLGRGLDPSHPHARGLFCWWLLNEGGGGLAADLSPYRNNGAAASTGVTRAAGPGGPGLTFSGSGVVSCAAAAGLPGNPAGAAPAPWSVECWLSQSATVSLSVPFGFGDLSSATVTGANRAFLQFGGSAPNNHIYLWGNSADWDTGVPWLTDGLPHHYLFASAGNGGTAAVRLFVDGVLAASGTPGGSLSVPGVAVQAGGQAFGSTFGGTLYSGRAWSADVSGLAGSLYADPYGAVLAPAVRRFFAPAAGGGAVTVAPTSVASAESEGTPSLAPGASSVSPSSVASGEVTGSPSLAATAPASPTSVASGETEGTPALAPGASSVAPTSVATGESEGTPSLAPGASAVAPDSVASAESVGAPTLTAPGGVVPTSVASGESVGTPGLAPSASVSPSSVASGESVGSPVLSGPGGVIPAAVPTGESEGTPSLAAVVATAPGSVASGEAVGSPALAGSVALPAYGSPLCPVVVMVRRRRRRAPAQLPPDLLSALVAYLRAAPTLTPLFTPGFGAGAFGGGGFGGAPQVWDEDAPADAYPPFLVVRGYTETLPGTAAEDEPVEASLVVVTNSLDQARDAAAAVKAAVDHPNTSAASLGRDPFVYEGGSESYLFRDASKPKRLAGLGRGGRYVYAEEIVYEFWTTPDAAALAP